MEPHQERLLVRPGRQVALDQQDQQAHDTCPSVAIFLLSCSDSCTFAPSRSGSRSFRGSEMLFSARAKLVATRDFARRATACVALAAMILQILLCFGHVHVHAPEGSAVSGVTAAGSAQTLPTSLVSQAHPAGLDDDEEPCSICFSGFLLSTTSLPDAPGHSPLFDIAGAGSQFISIPRAVSELRRSAFFSRGPPSLV